MRPWRKRRLEMEMEKGKAGTESAGHHSRFNRKCSPENVIGEVVGGS